MNTDSDLLIASYLENMLINQIVKINNYFILKEKNNRYRRMKYNAKQIEPALDLESMVEELIERYVDGISSNSYM